MARQGSTDCPRPNCSSISGVHFDADKVEESGSVKSRCSDCSVPTVVEKTSDGGYVAKIDFERTDGTSW